VRSFSQFATRLQGLGVALFLAGFYMVFPDIRARDGALISSLLIITGLLLPIRAVGYFVMRHRAFSDRVLILGTGPLARAHRGDRGPAPLSLPHRQGWSTMASVRRRALKYPLLGPLERLDKITEQVQADRIVVALAERRGRMPMRQLLDAEAQGILVEDGMATYEQFTGKLAIEALSPSFLVFSPGFRKTPGRLALRRGVPVHAHAGLVVTAPRVMAIIALAIKLDSASVFFIHERAGYRGHPFRLVKFRTMRDQIQGSDSSVWHRDRRARILGSVAGFAS
jgi:hypothetical protein